MPNDSTLSSLLSTKSLRLVYSVPLFLISLPLLFAGTFLTLDRTRTFPSHHEPIPLPGAFARFEQKWRILFGLRGGVGGLLSGYVFGLHFTTLMSLLIPAVSPSPPLSSGAFCAVWILSSTIMTILGGRFRYCALIFSPLCGGASLGVALSVIIHPPLLARQVIVPLFSILLTITILVFCIPRFVDFLRPTLRVGTASSGAFSLIVSIALLSQSSGWANIWERLWISDGDGWGSGKETGLSIAFCVFLCLGIATDWALRRWLGECPDEKWDHYLANYAANLPNDPSRAGVFQPFPQSLWDRLFYPPPKKDIIIFPSTSAKSQVQYRGSVSKDEVGLLSSPVQDPPQIFPRDELLASPTLLKKTRSAKSQFSTPARKRRNHKGILSERKPIKFLASDSDSSDDETSPTNSRSGQQNQVRPWLQGSSPTSPAPTLVETSASTQTHSESEARQPIKADRLEIQSDYSDFEGDLGLSKKSGGRVSVPRFTRRPTSAESTVDGSSHSGGGISARGNPSTPLASVPATPSLIKALNRVAAAHKEAFGTRNPSPFTHTHSLPRTSDVETSQMTIQATVGTKIVDHDESDQELGQDLRRRGWDEFWRDVRQKAES